jgi:hypothetical protein
MWSILNVSSSAGHDLSFALTYLKLATSTKNCVHSNILKYECNKFFELYSYFSFSICVDNYGFDSDFVCISTVTKA